MPAVNFELLSQAVRGAGVGFNQVVFWSRPLTWKNQTLTPNPDTIYVFPFYNTKDVGPVVMEIPPADQGSITGSIDAPSAPVPVTADNFIRAESDLYFAAIVRRGGFGGFFHDREPAPIDAQTVIRLNRDTLYSGALFDLDAGPVTITLPDAGSRFVSMQVISQDHYTTGVHYGGGRHTLTRQEVGTRYVLVAIRMLVDPAQPQDSSQVHALQDAIKVEQGDRGRFEVPTWDRESQGKVRELLLDLAATLPDTRRMFGTRAEVDPVRHFIGTASAWGGNPERDALYLNVVPTRNDGNTVYSLTVGSVPVDGFWSISLYNAQGYSRPIRGMPTRSTI